MTSNKQTVGKSVDTFQIKLNEKGKNEKEAN